jgi:hypothetical protein
MLPASMLRAEMFFVRVNRFWCVWIRVPVDGICHESGGDLKVGPGF